MKILFVTGPPRSGTTWITRELTKAKNSYPFLPECSTITKQIRLFHESKYLDKFRYQAYYGDQIECKKFFRFVTLNACNLARRLNPKSGAAILILKDPEISHYIMEVNELFQNKIMVIVRDPRDVISSLKQVSSRAARSFDIDDVIESTFIYYHSIINARSQGVNMVLCRYEDLIKTGVDSLFNVFDLEPFIGDKYVDASDIPIDRQDPFFTTLYLEQTTDERIGVYRNELTTDEINKVERVFSGVMLKLNYSVAE